jgi:HPt (histidine-containing phosphotransfer) domain-containing protein
VVHLDPEALAALEDLFSPEQMGKYIDLFRSGTAERLAQLGACADANDWAGVGAEAHAISGTAGTIGAIELERAARQLENACRRPEDPALLRSLVGVLHRLAEQTDAELRQRFAMPAQAAAA